MERENAFSSHLLTRHAERIQSTCCILWIKNYRLAKGVRCWYAPHDIKIGDKFRSRIDEAVRMYDKLLLVLSEHSIRSPWVEKEVEGAFEKERKRKKLVLFPVRLDDTVNRTRQAWAADIRRMIHIGNFTRWNDHGEYQKVFDKLLRDLQAQ